MVPPLVDEQKLGQARSKDGHAEEGAAEDEGQKEPIVPLHSTNAMR